MLYHQIAKAIAAAQGNGLSFIAKQQLPGGGFISYSTTKQADFSHAKAYQTTFIASLILTALATCTDQKAQAIRRRVADFLLAQRDADWSFNYWDKSSVEAKASLYPDDLDDTACALAALYEYDAKLFDGTVMASVANLLVATEVAEGGPYRTWLVPPDAPVRWQDVDVAVNANVGRFLALAGVKLPKVIAYLEQALQHGQLSSPYYPDSLPLIYFMAAWYRGGQKELLIKQLLSKQRNGQWNNPLHTALAVTSLLRLGWAVEPVADAAVDSLLTSQQADGGWPAVAFCIDPSQDGKRAYAGASALTTALCIEALALVQQTLASKPAAIIAKTTPKRAQYERVVRAVKAKIRALPSAEVKKYTNQTLERLLKQDSDHQIIMIPWLVSAAAQVPADETVCQQLAEASLWGWMTYTLFDDFLDGEGDPKFLPTAILSERNLLRTLGDTLPQDEVFHDEVARILDRLDAANSWEVTHCRAVIKNNILQSKQLPDYGDFWQLADRSLGHTIAGLGVLYSAGKKSNSPDIKALRTFFKHYLIARQLNDDLHDWESDLQMGHMNVAGTEVLKVWQTKTKQSVRSGINLTSEMNTLRRLFWQHVAPGLCKQVLAQVAKARQALVRSGQFDMSGLEQLLQKPERAAYEALAGQQDTLAFIRAMNN